MVLTRQQRERLVLDLYNQGKSTREIAEEARMSFKDIGTIIKKIRLEKEAELSASLSSQAYRLFSENKTPIQVAIALNLRQIEVTEFYKEYWNLQQLHDLCQVYQKIKYDIWSFLELYRLIKAAGMDLKHVKRLLEIANNELPKVEEAYKNLHGEVVKLNLTKQDAVTTILKLNGDIIYLRNAIEYQRLEREKQESEKRSLYLKKIRLESVIQQLQKSHEYARIVQIVKRQVSIAIGDDKQMLKLAFESIIESLLSDPFRLESLFEYATSSASTSTSAYCIENMDHDTKPGMYGKRYLSLDHEADRTQVEYLKNIILEESEAQSKELHH